MRQSMQLKIMWICKLPWSSVVEKNRVRESVLWKEIYQESNESSFCSCMNIWTYSYSDDALALIIVHFLPRHAS